MIIDDHIQYFTDLAEGRNIVPFKEWWNEHASQLEAELTRAQFLHLKIHSFDEICRLLDERKIQYKKSFANSNARATNVFFNRDPIERDPSFSEQIAQADEMAKLELKEQPRRMGSCHTLWRTKKRILKEQFGIDWKTPAEMNPHVFFD